MTTMTMMATKRPNKATVGADIGTFIYCNA